jgi:branched-chain amino acid transport system permease protein
MGIQLIISGILIGGVYALMSVGLSLIMGVLKVINSAHGDFVIVGGYTAFLLFSLFGMSPYVSWVVVIPVTFILGWLVFYLVRQTVGKDHVNQILLTIGLSIAIQNLLLLFFKSDFRTVPVIFETNIRFANIFLSRESLIAFVIGLAATGAFFLFLNKTQTGRAMRAVSQDRYSAHLMGINVPRTDALVFSLGFAMAGLAGCLLITMFAINPQIGSVYNLIAWITMVLGGLGRLPGALVAAFLIGIVETATGFYLGADFRQVVYYVLFILALIFFPNGIFHRVAKIGGRS